MQALPEWTDQLPQWVLIVIVMAILFNGKDLMAKAQSYWQKERTSKNKREQEKVKDVLSELAALRGELKGLRAEVELLRIEKESLYTAITVLVGVIGPKTSEAINPEMLVQIRDVLVEILKARDSAEKEAAEYEYQS